MSSPQFWAALDGQPREPGRLVRHIVLVGVVYVAGSVIYATVCLLRAML